MRSVIFPVMCAGVAVLAACERGTPSSSTLSSASPSSPLVAFSKQPRANDEPVQRGSALYVQYCQACHAVGGVGAANWRKMDADNMYPPPPLDASGHAWHHSSRVLRQFILEGSQPGQGRMPAWRGKLSDGDVADLILWMQSLWPDEIYGAWQRMEQSSP